VPGCLITEDNYKLISETLMTIKSTAEQILTTVEVFWDNGSCEKEYGYEPSWTQLEDNVTNLLRGCIKVYRFFKNGIDMSEEHLPTF
jgi:hypothetical protein